MDPDVLLDNLLGLARTYNDLDTLEHARIPDVIDDLRTLAQGVLNLTQWLDDGGFLPRRWLPGTSSFHLAMATDNAAFAGDDDEVLAHRGIETARVLRRVADSVFLGEPSGLCRDANGNAVGIWRFTP